MSATLFGAALIGRAAAPLFKDIYVNAKGGVKKELDRWATAGFASKMAKKLAEIDKVRTIWSPEKNVSLRSFYYPSKIRSLGGEIIAITSIGSLGDGCHVIQGIVGQGKSVLLRYLALQEIVENQAPRIPLFLELRKVTKSTSLLQLIYKTISEFDVKVDEDIFSYLASTGRIVLLLDGFDELETSLVRETTLELEHLATKHPELQIIVSSRPNNEIQKLNSFRVHEIAPLTFADYTPFLRALGLATTKIVDIVHAINSSPSKVAELITTPLMLTLVVFVYQSEKQIPSDLPEFFDRLFYTVFTRHDKLKPAFEREHYSELSERKLQTLFEAFCFMALQLGSSRTLSREQFGEAFELAQDYVEGSKCSDSAFRKDITKVACLMLEEGVGDTTFLHKSIAEYHAAAFVRSSDDSFAERFYSEAAKSWQHWRECLVFLQSIDPYRFSKYFAIENINNAIPVFEKLGACTTGVQMVKMLPLWIKGLSVRYRRNTQRKNYILSSFGTWSPADSMYTSELGDVLGGVAFKIAPATLSKSEIGELRSAGVIVNDEGDGELAIPLSAVLDRWGFSEYRAAFEVQISNLRVRLAEAKVHSEKLAKRSLIFDRKRRE